jgi:hypothetical protein
MPRDAGHRLPLSPARRMVVDLMHFCRAVPMVPMERPMDLAAVAAARAAADPRPGWCALFTKAYAAVAARRPELRRAFFRFPWPHLYEYPEPVAAVAVERHLGDEDVVLFAVLRSPHARPLADIDAWLKRCKADPVERIGSFRRAMRVAQLPRPLRRLAWWLGLEGVARWRARVFGTFAVSVTAGLGAATLAVPAPGGTVLHYSPLTADGRLAVRLTFDHRVLDGGTAARALADLEQVLRGELLGELRGLAGAAAA